MRRVAVGVRQLVPIFLLACTSHTVPVVSVSMLPVSPQTSTDATLLSECRIVGAGERRHWWEGREEPRFDVFSSRFAKDASLVIAQPNGVAATWSHFPVPS